MSGRDQIVDDRELTRARSEDRGVLSPLLMAGLTLAMAFLVWFPIGQIRVHTSHVAVGARPRRSRRGESPHPQGHQERHCRAGHVHVCFVAFLVVFPFGRANSTITDFGLYAVFSVCVIGMNLMFGYAGQVSIAQAAFLGIGAYTSVLLDSGREIEAFGMVSIYPISRSESTVVIAIAAACFSAS